VRHIDRNAAGRTRFRVLRCQQDVSEVDPDAQFASRGKLGASGGRHIGCCRTRGQHHEQREHGDFS
jgi:hypothetical protein